MRRALALLLCACEAADPTAASDSRTDPAIAPTADLADRDPTATPPATPRSPVPQDSPRPTAAPRSPVAPSATTGSDSSLSPVSPDRSLPIATPSPSPAPPSATTGSNRPPVLSVSPPPGFVDLRVALPDACFTAGYAAADNFTGAPLPGYGAAGAWLLAGAADALARAQAELRADDLSLQIFDAYRPRRASEAMVAWAERTGRSQLLADGYIARRSGHNHGHTVDLGLARRGTCEPLDMGTAWDTLDTRSHTASATGQARSNRLRLLAVMRAAGFHAYPKEWWHFSLPLPDTRPRDVPYGPHEPPEAHERD